MPSQLSEKGSHCWKLQFSRADPSGIIHSLRTGDCSLRVHHMNLFLNERTIAVCFQKLYNKKLVV